MMRAIADTPAAVYAKLINNMSFPIMYADCLGGAVLDAVDTALTGLCLQTDRTHKFIHSASLLILLGEVVSL
jgi:hypothetical protein